MAITRYAGDRFTTNTSDTKPTGVLDGAYLIDTGNLTQWVRRTVGGSSQWNQLAGGGGGGGTPGGANTQVQFNNAGAFGGNANLTFDGSKLAVNDLALSGIIYDSNNSIGNGGMVLTNEGTTGVNWKSIESVLSGVGGSGVANYVARWSDEDTITSGVIQDDGTAVGINQAADPDNALAIKSIANNTNPLQIAAHDGDSLLVFRQTAGDGRLSIKKDGGVETIRLDSDNVSYINGGNVGIGTNNPAFKLQVQTPAVPANNAYVVGFDVSRPNSASRGFTVGSNSAADTWTLGAHNADMRLGHTYGTDTGGQPTFYPDLTIKHSDQSAGNVGIGTTDPGGKLESYITSGGEKGLRLNSNFAGGNTVDFIPAIVGVSNAGFSIDLAGTNRLVINSGGNVGVGTNSPSHRLHVLGATTGGWNGLNLNVVISSSNTYANGHAGGIAFGGAYNSSETQTVLAGVWASRPNAGDGQYAGMVHIGAREHGTSNIEKVLNVSHASVGIGTNLPTSMLQVDHSGGADVDILTLDNNRNTQYDKWGIKFQDSFRTRARIQTVNMNTGNARAGLAFEVGFSTDTVERMRINDNGNVGIGTDNPQQLLHINGSSPIIRFRDSDATGTPLAHIDASGGALKLQADSSDETASSFLTLEVDGSEHVRVIADGNVGIGTTAPTEKLDVEGSLVLNVATGTGLGEEGIFFRRGFSDSDKYNVSILSYAHDGSGNFSDGISINGYDGVSVCTGGNSRQERMRIVGGTGATSGYVGIGTDNPLAHLMVGDGNRNAGASVQNQAGYFIGTKSAFADAANTGLWQGQLHIADDSALAAGIGGAITFGATQDNTNGTYLASIEGSRDNATSGQYGASMIFRTRTNGSAVMGEHMVIASDGNVGIGTNAPSSKLHIRESNPGSFVYDSTADTLIVEGNGNAGITIATAAANTSRIIFASPNDATGAEIKYSDATSLMTIGNTNPDDSLAFQAGNGVEAVRIISDGNVGIGTTSPGRHLAVTDLGQIKLENNSTGNWAGIDLKTSGGTNNYTAYFGMLDSNGNFFIDAASNGDDVIIRQTGETHIGLQGNVGIGTLTTAQKLHVAGSTLISNNNYHYGYTSGGALATLIGITDSNNLIVGQNNANFAHAYIYGGTGDINLNPVGDVKVNNANLFVDGSVGIGIDSPGAPLHIYQNSASALEILFENDGAGQTGLTLRSDRNSDGNLIGFLNFDGNDDGNNNTRYGTIEAFIADNTGGTEDGRLTFSTMVAGSDTETMHIMGGSVGIGAAPSAPLDIHTANSSGTALRIISGNNLQFLNAANNTNANIYNNGATGESELAFQISGSTKVTIDNGGNVGIGTTTPNERLHVYIAGNDIPLRVQTDDHVGVEIKGGTSHDIYLLLADTATNAKIGWDHSATALKFNASASFSDNHLVVKSTGVGIGIENPSTALHVAGQGTFANNGANIILKNTWSSGNQDILFGGGSVSTGAATNTAARIRSLATAPGGAATGDLLFTVNSGDSLVDAIYIKETGAITFNSAYTFPTAIGSAGQVLKVPSSGTVLEWSTETGPVSGTGTTNTIPRWTGTASLGDSIITVPSNTSVQMAGELTLNYTSPILNIGKLNTSTGNAKLRFNSKNGTAANAFDIQFVKSATEDRLDFLAGGATTMASFLNGGQVGIGTTNPIYTLHVKAAEGIVRTDSTTGTNRSGFQMANTGGTGFIMATSSAGNGVLTTGGLAYALQINKSGGSTDAWNAVQIGTKDIARMTIDESGNVGIGTNNPDSQLHVLGDTLKLERTNNAPALKLYNNNASPADDAALGYLQFTGKDNNGTANMVYSEVRGGVQSNTNSAVSGYLSFLTTNNGTAVTEAMRIKADGSVGIATTTPAAKLDVRGNILRSGLTFSSWTSRSINTLTQAGATINYILIAAKTTINVRLSGRFKCVRSNGVSAVSIAHADVVFCTDNDANPQSGGIHSAASDIPTYGHANFEIVELTYNSTDCYALKISPSASWTAAFAQIEFEGISNNVIWTNVDSGNVSNIGAFGGSQAVFAYKHANVGIGTDSPAARLHITSDGSHDEGAEIVLRHANNNSTDVVSTLSFQNNGGQVAMIQGGTTSGNTNGYISLFTDNSGTSGERMRIISDGNVGIGTNAPSELLEVDGNIRLGDGTHRNIIGPTNATLGIYSNPNDSNEGIKFSTDGGSTIEMFLQDGGNVGIGTETPKEKLHVNNGSSSGDGVVYPLRLSAGAQASTAGDATGIKFIQRDQYNDYGGYIRLANTASNPGYLNPRLEFGVQNTNTNVFGSVSTKMVITGGGSVGIGEVAPGTILHLKQNDAVGPTISLTNNPKTAYINFWGATGGGTDRTNQFEINAVHTGYGITLASKDYVRFKTDGIGAADEAMRINSDGNVGIGTTQPGVALDVNGKLSIGSPNASYDLYNNGTTYLNGSVTIDALLSITGTAASQSIINSSTTDSAAADSYLNIFKTAGSGGGSRATLRVGYDAANCFQVSRIRNNANIYINSRQSGSSMVFQIADNEQMALSSGQLKFPDNKKIIMGASNDLQIYHDGDNWIDANGAGNLYLRNLNSSGDVIVQAGASGDAYIKVHSGETALKATNNGAVELYYNNTKTFQTTASGVKLTQSTSYLFGGDDEILAGQDSSGYYFATGNGQNVNKPIFIGDNASYIQFKTSDVEVVRIDANGNVGIGTTNPGSYKLLVNGNSYLDGTAYVDGLLTVDGDIDLESAGQYITFYGNSSADHSISSRNSAGNAADDLRINTYGALFINLDSNGNNTSGADFSIGRHAGTGAFSASDWLLDLSGETGQLKLNKYGSGTHTGTAEYQLSVDSNGNIIETTDGGGNVSGGGTNGKITKWSGANGLTDSSFLSESGTTLTNTATLTNFSTNNATVTLSAYGRLGVGTNSATSPFISYLADNSTWSGDHALIRAFNGGNRGARGHGDGSNLLKLDFSDACAMIVNKDGSVGIGTTSPDAVFRVVNSAASGGTFKFTDGSSRTLMDLGGGVLSWNAASVFGAGSWAGTADHEFQTLTTTRDTVYIDGPTSGTNHALFVDGMKSYFGGSVGIGTGNPERKLHVFKGESSGATSNSDSTLVLENSSHTYVQFLTPATSEAGILFGDSDNDRGALTYSHNNDSMNFRVAANTRMFINSSGYIGIGTTNPASLLHVLTGAPDFGVGAIIQHDTSSAGRFATLSFGAGSYRKAAIAIESSGDTNGTGDLVFAVDSNNDAANVASGDEKMRIQSDGNVGIGTDDPADILSIQVPSSTTKGIFFQDGSTSTYGTKLKYEESTNNFYIEQVENNVQTGILTIKRADGNVGIGTTGPNQKLDVNGTAYFRDDIYFGNTVLNPASGFSNQTGMGWDKSTGQLQIAANGTAALEIGRHTSTGTVFSVRYASTQKASIDTSGNMSLSGTLTEASSLAIKENIEDFTPRLDIINKIRPVKYNKKKESKKEIGLIAEELAELFPELVEKDKNGNPSGVNYSRAVTVLLGGFKELYKEVQELKKRI